ncbi:MAG: hypothetical protein ACR2LR_01325 [Hassallia sp.]
MNEVFIISILSKKICSHIRAIAIFEPKIGRKGYKAFITAVSYTPAYRIGELRASNALKATRQSASYLS